MKKNRFSCLLLVFLFVCVLLASCTPQGGEVTTDPIIESDPITETESPETTVEVTEIPETTDSDTVTEIPETTVIPEIYEAYAYFYLPDGNVEKVTVKPDTVLTSAVFESVELPTDGNGVKVEHKGWEYSLTEDGERKIYDFAAPPIVTLEGLHIYPVLEYSYLVSFGAGEGTFREGAVTEFYFKAGEVIDPADLLARMPEKAEDAEYIYPFLGFSLDGTNVIEFPTTVGKQPLEFTALYGKEKIEHTLIIHTEYGELIGGGKTKFVSGTQSEIEALLELYSTYKPDDVYLENARYIFKELKVSNEGREWTLELVWDCEVLKYTVSFDRRDGNSHAVTYVSAGGKIVLPTEERREDEVRYYNFVGWRDNKGYLYNGGYEYTVTENTSFRAEYINAALKVYTVVFDTEIGSFADGSPAVILTGHYGDPLDPPQPPMTEKLTFGEVVYSFAGWDREPSAVFCEDASYTAVYTTPETVFFLDFYINGELYMRVPHYASAKLEAPERPAFTIGKIFSGWQDLPETMPASDLTVEATARDAQIIYVLDGEVILRNSAEVGSLVTLAAPAQKHGHTVSGWSTSDLTVIAGNSFVMPEKDVCFNAVSTPNNHTVTYIIDGVTLYTDSVCFGEIYTVRGIEVKTGFEFTGWKTDIASLSGDDIIVIPDQDVVYVASYVPHRYAVSYFLDGELLYRDEFLYGEEVVLRPDEEQEGCSFFWSSAEVSISKGKFTMPAGNVDIYGAFSDGDNKIIFIVDSAPYGSIGVTAGQTVNLSLMPTKRGYTFTGWNCDEVDVSEGVFIMPEGDIVLRGSFIPNAYDVIFLDMLTGDVIGTSYLDYGATFSFGDRVYCAEGRVSSGWVLLLGDVIRKGDEYIMPDSEVVFGIVWENCLTIEIEEDYWIPYYDHLEYECEKCLFDEQTGTLYISDPTVRVAGESEGITVVFEYEKQ